jgi:AcrR family transcriptional regulator
LCGKQTSGSSRSNYASNQAGNNRQSGRCGLSEYVSGCKNFQMAVKRPQSPERKPRADAQRNRERILKVAKQAFTRSGANASLDDIAKEAGVGPRTLYRQFPTRDDLLEAVYRPEVEKLAAAERKFADSIPSVEALRAWMLLFVD